MPPPPINENPTDFEEPSPHGTGPAGAHGAGAQACGTLHVDLDGFEGPLDLLLTLARTQKVDLLQISILHLAEQYLTFIRTARNLKIDLAADYLVMAAWLAWLKSRLLLPETPDVDEEPGAEEMAALLAHRLRRLQAMRRAMAQLMERPRLGRDVFARGQPEPIRTRHQVTWEADLYDLLAAYARRRNLEAPRTVTIRKRRVWSVKQARQRLEELLGTSLSWAPLDRFIRDYMLSGEERRTALASSFVASLEMAREGVLDLRQNAPFAPLFVKRRQERKQQEP